MERYMPSLERSIKDLKAILSNPPTSLVSGVGQCGPGGVVTGGESSSKQDRYVVWAERQQQKLDQQISRLSRRKAQVEIYHNIMENMVKDLEKGKEAAEILKQKYTQGYRPYDHAIGRSLYLSRSEFYRVQQTGLKYIYDILFAEG